MGREIDHIVYCVPDLDEAMDKLENLLGVRPVIGGSHLTKGTKNALLNLGKKCYLEILAVDHENTDFEGERWMGIDLITQSKITRWSLKSDDLENDSTILSRYSPKLAKINDGSRKTTSGNLLSWKMILPTTRPEVEILPFMTDWTQSDVHPTDALEPRCSLKNISLFHPDPMKLQGILNDLNINIEILHGDEAQISIDLMSPNGLVSLF